MCVLTRCGRSHLLSQVLSPSHVGLVAWIASKDQGSSILLLRDASGIRGLAMAGVRAEELLGLPRETLLCVKGYYDGSKLWVEDYEVCVEPLREPPSYLDLPGDPEALARRSPWYMKHPRWSAVLRLQQHVLRYAREYLYGQGFVELLPPMVSVVSDPGLRGARKLETAMYGHRYELTSSAIMYKQAGTAIFERIFFVARNIREEPVENLYTGRHLAEFTQLDVEAMLMSSGEAMRLAEGMLAHVSRRLLDRHGELVEGLNPGFEGFEPPFERISYDEALDIAKRLGFSARWGDELSHEAETAVAEHLGAPTWITGFPVESRGFYYLSDPDDPRYNRDFNLVLPKGYGEVIDGGEREYRSEELARRIEGIGEDLEKYRWFLELAEAGGVPPSAGWGLGVERITRYIAGERHVVTAAAFPKPPGIAGTP